MSRIADLVEEYLSLVGNGQHRQGLPAGATDGDIDAASAALGFDVPADLAELLRVHNGGSIFDVFEWARAAPGGRGTLPERYRYFMGEAIGLFKDATADLTFLPSGRYLYIAGADRFWFLYDLDVVPGRLLASDTHSLVGVVPLAQSLESLLVAYVELAKMGVMEWQGKWFSQGGDHEDKVERLRSLGVTEAAAVGIETVPDFVNGTLPEEWAWAKPPAPR